MCRKFQKFFDWQQSKLASKTSNTPNPRMFEIGVCVPKAGKKWKREKSGEKIGFEAEMNSMKIDF